MRHDNDRKPEGVMYALLALFAMIVVAVLVANRPARAHEAPTGWTYPQNCCSNQDCEMIPDGVVEEKDGGYLVPSGEVIPYSDVRVKPSPDGHYHWCHYYVSDMYEPPHHATRCVFVPGAGV